MFNGHSHGGIMSNFVLKHRNIETHGATGMLFVLTPGCPLLLALRIPVANPAVANPTAFDRLKHSRNDLPCSNHAQPAIPNDARKNASAVKEYDFCSASLTPVYSLQPQVFRRTLPLTCTATERTPFAVSSQLPAPTPLVES